MADSVAGAGADRHAAAPDVVAVVLAAGAGRRLRPLTALCPKPLCPVGGVALLDRALAQLRAVTPVVAVNLHHGRAAIEAHLDELDGGLPPPGRWHRSIEAEEALGTAGALGRLRSWIDGRAALVVNADTWHDADLASLTAGWDGVRVRVLMAPPAGGDHRFGPGVGIVASLLPWAEVARLAPVPSGLYEVVWRQAAADGRLDAVVHGGRFADCGTAADYLRANALARAEAGLDSIVAADAVGRGSVTRSVIGAGAVIDGAVRDAVVWPGSRVGADELVVGAVRAGPLTVVVR